MYAAASHPPAPSIASLPFVYYQQAYYSYNDPSAYIRAPHRQQPQPPPPPSSYGADAYRGSGTSHPPPLPYHPPPPPYSPSAPQAQSGSFDSSGSASGGGPLLQQSASGYSYPPPPPLLPMAVPSMNSIAAPPQGYGPPTTIGPPPVHRSGGAYPTHHQHQQHPPSYPPPPSFFWGGTSTGLRPSAYPHSTYSGPNPHHPYLPYPAPPSLHGLLLPPLAHPSFHSHHHHDRHRHPSSGTMVPPAAIVEYITEIHPQDVLSGRGGATNSHSGNRSFRKLVKEHQDKYLKAKKRDKPAVAALIVELVRKRGGRFLRRIEDPSSHRHGSGSGGDGGDGYGIDPGRMPLYVDIGDDRALEKTCQALREGAPEIRRKKQVNSSDESATVSVPKSPSRGGGHGNSSPSRPSSLAVALSTTSTSSLSFDVNHRSPNASGTTVLIPAGSPSDPNQYQGETHQNNQQPRRGRPGDGHGDGDGDEDRFLYSSELAEGPIMIRPASRFMPGRPAISPHPIDHLSAEDRDVYLAFLPPYPSIRTKRLKTNTTTAALNPNAVPSVSEELDGQEADGRHRLQAGNSSVPSLLKIVRA